MESYSRVTFLCPPHPVHLGDDVFTQAINLAMQGERKDLNDRFETGDEVRFYMEDLESVTDPNVQKLVALLDRIEETMHSLANINGLKNEDWGKPWHKAPF